MSLITLCTLRHQRVSEKLEISHQPFIHLFCLTSKRRHQLQSSVTCTQTIHLQIHITKENLSLYFPNNPGLLFLCKSSNVFVIIIEAASGDQIQFLLSPLK